MSGKEMKKLIDSDKLFESTTVPLIDLVNSAHKFKVPEFQRDYDWKTGEKARFINYLQTFMKL